MEQKLLGCSQLAANAAAESPGFASAKALDRFEAEAEQEQLALWAHNCLSWTQALVVL